MGVYPLPPSSPHTRGGSRPSSSSSLGSQGWDRPLFTSGTELQLPEPTHGPTAVFKSVRPSPPRREVLDPRGGGLGQTPLSLCKNAPEKFLGHKKAPKTIFLHMFSLKISQNIQKKFSSSPAQSAGIFLAPGGCLVPPPSIQRGRRRKGLSALGL